MARLTTSMPAATSESAALIGARKVNVLFHFVPRLEIVHSRLATTRSARSKYGTTFRHGASGPLRTMRRPIDWASITSPTAIKRTVVGVSVGSGAAGRAGLAVGAGSTAGVAVAVAVGVGRGLESGRGVKVGCPSGCEARTAVDGAVVDGAVDGAGSAVAVHETITSAASRADAARAGEPRFSAVIPLTLLSLHRCVSRKRKSRGRPIEVGPLSEPNVRRRSFQLAVWLRFGPRPPTFGPLSEPNVCRTKLNCRLAPFRAAPADSWTAQRTNRL